MTEDSNSGGEAPRRRRPQSIAYRDKVDAVAIVGSVGSRLGAWSPRVAFLRAAVSRRAAHGAQGASRTEATGILREVRSAREELAERCRGLPPAIASHGRVIDANRALDALEAQLLEIIAQLPP